MIARPRLGSASAALKSRLSSTCWISLSSAKTRHKSGARTGSTLNPAETLVVGDKPQGLGDQLVDVDRLALRGRGACEIYQVFERARDAGDLREDRVQRGAAFGSFSPVRSDCTSDEIDASGLLTSCATPAAKVPAAASRSALSSESSISRRWVTSRRIIWMNCLLP